MRPTREQLAHHFLPQYGEAELAERVVTITDAGLERIGEVAGYYAWSEEAMELLGGRMGGTRAARLATIDVLEGTIENGTRRFRGIGNHLGAFRRLSGRMS
jgi:hypothetical protein